MFRISSNINKVLVQIKQEIDTNNIKQRNIVKTVAIQGFSNIQTRSPVDTGLFRASHELTIGKPSERHGRIPSYKQKRDNMAGLRSKYAEQAKERLDQSKNRLQGIPAKGNFTIWITNNLKYAKALEDGHSKQAPKGVYKIVGLEVSNMFKRAASLGEFKT